MFAASTSPATRPRLPRIIGIVALTAAFLLLAGGVATAQTISNPLDGVNPDLSLLGPALNSTWKRILAAVWGGCIAVAGLYVLTSGLSLKKARKRGMSSDLSEATDDWKMSLYVLGIVAAASPIIGGVLFLVGG
ncbi:hypothetical protein QMK17_22900 [Rhodococcus sp. G-MC3]|uniref:hypothetical protein n=1 Tax=Rhodococcus sp. G-MC3 TaxID=3046209 RepID=UPI0024BA002A|nr:hypothetical protein [Rhodococcus sp. G-MC3]MDJ0396171.1 hypothetical protein [Rhodococcus sp. G-MC3]